MNDTRDSEDPCFEQWQTGISGLKGLFLGGVPAYFNGHFPNYSEHTLADLSVWTWLNLKGHSRNNAGVVNLKSNNPRETPNIIFHALFEGVGDGEDLQAVNEDMKYGIEAIEN
ncbi:uncharacterized protein ColSpa_06839 [Colletotrichum spaethianum]|uniref:Uncharacterized protein n=1 Tax=Colletotrichum spaethianum TaxID=700344 RepID=A0AA37P2L1_9PEZI|nr:uncharacterized protein ColSpa_06839 [Colletotrichum spaethianum]GKT46658.1 hypothetical protein ColSpa_06839 [Colletotrichum spaethianum]